MPRPTGALRVARMASSFWAAAAMVVSIAATSPGAYLGGEDVLPPAHTVAFVTDAVTGDRPDQLHPPSFRRTDGDDGLARYADR